MTPSDVAALTVSILAGLTAVISALTALLQAYRTRTDLAVVKAQVNGRLDQLLREREERLRAEAALHMAAIHAAKLAGPPTVDRPEPIIREITPDEPKGE